MQRVVCAAICVLMLFSLGASAQYPPFTKWYQNPLGFNPVNLHTSNGIIIPGFAAAAILIFTPKDTNIKKKLSYYDNVGLSWGYYGSRTTVYQNNIGLLYSVRSYMALGVEFTAYYVADDVNNTYGLGIRPFVRFYPVNKENFRLFFQSGAGLIWFAQPFPQPSGFFGDRRIGTQLNGCPKYGIGTELNINKRLSTQLGLWHVHVSNGNNPSRDRNPGHDSNGFSIGLMYKP